VTRTRIMLLTVLIGLWPAHAHAARGFWAWLEELSGPGPFHGRPIVAFTVACIGPDHTLEWCTPEDKRPSIVIQLGSLHTEGGPRFSDLSPDDPDNKGEVRVVPFSAGVMYHPHQTLAFGPAVGFMRFSGKGFSSFYRLTLTPVSMSVTPFAAFDWKSDGAKRLARVLRFELETSFVPQGFSGKDFNNLRTRFDSGPEFLTRVATVIDIGRLIPGW
jgi:hypothetical protein